MSCPTCQALIADCVDDTALYSIESSIFPFVFQCPTGFDCGLADSFKMTCCGQLFSVDFPIGIDPDTKQSIIQSIVNQCAAILPTCGQNQGCANPPCDPPPPTTTLYYNRDATCTLNCPDGTPFVYTVPAGTFASFSQSDADSQALAYACEQVALRRVCIGAFSRCLCSNVPFSLVITSEGGLPPIHFSVNSGGLPDGLGMTTGGVISGTPTVPGVFQFSIRATTADGGYNIKPFVISVLDIVTTSITGYTVGTPYSFQMLGAGGSGNYNWSIESGTLPDGLSMDSSGLISGTPTGGLGTSPIVFRLIDTVCETGVQTLQPPRITMATQSTTQIATVRGYDEFIPSRPPKRYHTVSWAGTSEQKLFVNGVQIGGAKYEYGDIDHINGAGKIDGTHTKIFSAQCFDKANLIYAQIQGSGALGQSVILPFKGYYGMQVSNPGLLGNPVFLCPNSSIPYAVVGDIAINGTFDQSDLWGDALFPGTTNVGISKFLAQDSTTKASTDSGTASALVLPYNPIINVGINIANIPPDFFTPGSVEFSNSYSCQLLDEYTDAEALINARVILGNASTAQNLPRTTGFVSNFTNVVFTLLATNLVENQNYLVSVDLWNQNTAVIVTKQYGFTADATGKHTITDVVTTPPAGQSIQVRNPRIAFSP